MGLLELQLTTPKEGAIGIGLFELMECIEVLTHQIPNDSMALSSATYYVK